MQLTKQLSALALLAVLCACGSGGGEEKKTSSLSYKRSYAEPKETEPAVPVVRLNSGLSTEQIAVFDVVANSPSTLIRGYTLNLSVDLAKVAFVPVPGGNQGALAGDISTAGFGGDQGKAIARLDAQGCNLMGMAIRAPGAPQAAQGVLMRFALKLKGDPVEGVIRTEVKPGSGLLDAKGNLIPQKTPTVMGRLEMVKTS